MQLFNIFFPKKNNQESQSCTCGKNGENVKIHLSCSIIRIVAWDHADTPLVQRGIISSNVVPVSAMMLSMTHPEAINGLSVEEKNHQPFPPALTKDHKDQTTHAHYSTIKMALFIIIILLWKCRHYPSIQTQCIPQQGVQTRKAILELINYRRIINPGPAVEVTFCHVCEG